MLQFEGRSQNSSSDVVFGMNYLHAGGCPTVIDYPSSKYA